jgi:hypothetical protein
MIIFPSVYAAEVWLWGNMVLVDSTLYFLCAVLGVSQWLS